MSFLEEDEAPPALATAGLASVLVPYPVDRAYTYAVPAGMELKPGDYVTVPLGGREVPGVVWDAPVDEDVPVKKLKTLVWKHDFPPMAEVQRKFIDWAAHYNMAPLGYVMKMTLSVPGPLEPPKAATGYRLRPEYLALMTPSPQRGEGGGEGAGSFKPKPPEVIADRAKELRRDQTDAEKKLWHLLNNRQLEGYKFRRQHPVPPYIADFVCLEHKLIVELDGGQHAEMEEEDKRRMEFLESEGFRVLRFWNNEVMENDEGVRARIFDSLQAAPSPQPSPRRGEGVTARDRFVRNLSPARRKIVEAMADGIARRASEIADISDCTPAVVKGLEKLGVLETVPLHGAAPGRNPDPNRPGPVLSEAQKMAAEQLVNEVREHKFRATLLDGVTGAGKTEVYFEAIAEALKKGQQVLLLLPEIALSNAFLERFKKRFGCAPAMWHSSVSAVQRKNTWRGVAEGQCKVVVGARSALFLPFADLGLIIVDEEHDPAYKQEDGVIYNARDMAIVRAHLGKIPIVLVSATPSLETMSNIWNGRYDLIELPNRHGAAEMPDIQLIDMKVDKPERQSFIAPTLRQALADNLAKGEQSLLFLNRRGYAPLTLCRTCGQKMECPRCTAWLVEHRGRKKLECHHCGYFMPFPKACPSCHDVECLAPCGPGVERIVEEVKLLFPEARTVVLASDTAGTHDELRALLNDIRDHKYDIIVGTQIIAKGHHFPRLTCVGVVDADLGLKGGDLRAAERTFQVLHQVSGRAGREHLPGKVYLQTWMPGNKVMQALLGHQRDLFLQIEAAERQEARMPPYSRLAGIIVSGKDEKLVLETAQALGKCAPQQKEIHTLGPAEAPFYRLRGNYRRRLLVRAEKNVDIQKAIGHWMEEVKVPSSIRVYIDIDPQSFL